MNELMVDDTVNDKGVGVRLLTIHKAKGLESNDECDNSKDTNKNADIMDAEICSERYVN